MQEITTKELADKRRKDPTISIIDVREDFEVAEGMIPGAKHIPMGEISRHLDEIDKEKTQYVICRSGGRSGKVCKLMDKQGYDTINIDGGMRDWEENTDK